MFGIFPGGSAPTAALQREIVSLELKLAFYDEPTRSVMVLNLSEDLDAWEELHQLVQETVRIELLVVSRHGSQIMRAPSFSRRPNSGMLTAPDGSAMAVVPTVESRLRLLRARAALVEHSSTPRVNVPAGDKESLRRILDAAFEQYTTRLTYARWLMEMLDRETTSENAAPPEERLPMPPYSTSGAQSATSFSFDMGSLLLRPLQGLLSAAHPRPNHAKHGMHQ